MFAYGGPIGHNALHENVIARKERGNVGDAGNVGPHLFISLSSPLSPSICSMKTLSAHQYKPDGTCVIKRLLVEVNSSNLFTNVKSWFPPKTTCSYIFEAPQPGDRISLHFLWFRIDRVTLCE